MIASGELYEKILRDEETLKQWVFSRLEAYFLKNKDFSTTYEGLDPIFPEINENDYSRD